jgi:hypothetical protein
MENRARPSARNFEKVISCLLGQHALYNSFILSVHSPVSQACRRRRPAYYVMLDLDYFLSSHYKVRLSYIYRLYMSSTTTCLLCNFKSGHNFQSVHSPSLKHVVDDDLLIMWFVNLDTIFHPLTIKCVSHIYCLYMLSTTTHLLCDFKSGHNFPSVHSPSLKHVMLNLDTIFYPLTINCISHIYHLYMSTTTTRSLCDF